MLFTIKQSNRMNYLRRITISFVGSVLFALTVGVNAQTDFASQQKVYLAKWATYTSIANQAKNHAAFDAVMTTAKASATVEELAENDGLVWTAFKQLVTTGKITVTNVEPDYTGATADNDGTHGLVPKPVAGKQKSYLKGDGNWTEISGPDITSTFILVKTLYHSGIISMSLYVLSASVSRPCPPFLPVHRSSAGIPSSSSHP